MLVTPNFFLMYGIYRINIFSMRDVLLEYHHTYDNGLMQDAENIADIAIGIIKTFLDGGTSPEQIREYLNSYEAKPSFKRGILSMGYNRLSKPYKIDTLGISTRIYVVLITTCADIKGKFVAVNFDTVLDAINTDNNQVISSAIYHELGHLTNSSKSGFDQSQTSIDFKTPLFLSLDEDEYKKVTKALYRFHMRELKARCFETKMFLEKNKNEDITIQDIYDNRCSDITLMREFIEMLKKGAEEGPDSKNGGILNSISKDTWEYTWSDRRMFGDDKARWKLKCKNTIAYFQRRLDWFKKRIDKIFYDYKSKPQDRGLDIEITENKHNNIMIPRQRIKQIINESVASVLKEGKLRRVTLRYLKQLVRDGYAIDISKAEEQPERLNQIGYAAGEYGCNGIWAVGEETGKKYVIIGRVPNLWKFQY